MKRTGGRMCQPVCQGRWHKQVPENQSIRWGCASVPPFSAYCSIHIHVHTYAHIPLYAWHSGTSYISTLLRASCVCHLADFGGWHSLAQVAQTGCPTEATPATAQWTLQGRPVRRDEGLRPWN